MQGKTRVIDLDLRAYFDSVQHYLLLEKIARRIQDADVMRLLKLILKSTGKKGVPQGGVISPVLSNVYLNEKASGFLDLSSAWCEVVEENGGLSLCPR